MLKSAWTEEWDRPDTPNPSACRCSRSWRRVAQRRISRGAFTAGSGAEKLANYFVGQIVGTMNQRKTSSQVVFEMIDEFIETVERLGRLLES
jgi:NAD(P)H-dependent flavin oxidoreductase YrpB (nitropropane dioxygenase family)